MKKYIWLVSIPLSVVLAYGATIHGPFVYDDRIHVLENPAVTGFRGVMDAGSLNRIFRGALGLQGRPLLFLTYGLNYWYSGADPSAFRRTNLLIHTANCLLIFLLILELSRFSEVSRDRRFAAAILGGILFAAHPLLTESVSYVAGRSSSLCALFYFPALILGLRGERSKGATRIILTILGAICSALALLVKQDAIAIPLAAIALTWLYLRAGSFRSRMLTTFFWVSLLFAALFFQNRSIAATAKVTQGNAALVAAGFEETLPMKAYLLTSIKEIPAYYLWRMFVPFRLSVDPSSSIIDNWTSPRFWISAALLLALCAFAVHIRNRAPMMAAGIALIIVSPLSAYAVFPLADVVSEHRAYISTAGGVILLAALLVRSSRPAVFSAVILAVYFWLTISRNTVWQDEIVLWNNATELAPEKLRPHLNLGALYQIRGEIDKAVPEYEFVLKRTPEHDAALANLGSLYLAANQPEKSEALLGRAVARESRFPAVYLNLAVVRLRQGRLGDARKLLGQAQSLNPLQLMIHHNLGDIYFNENRPDRAIGEYLAELQINPNSGITHLHLAKAYEAVNAPSDALQHSSAPAPGPRKRRSAAGHTKASTLKGFQFKQSKCAGF